MGGWRLGTCARWTCDEAAAGESYGKAGYGNMILIRFVELFDVKDERIGKAKEKEGNREGYVFGRGIMVSNCLVGNGI